MGHAVYIGAVQSEISNSNSQLFFVTANWHPRDWTQRKKSPQRNSPHASSDWRAFWHVTRACWHFIQKYQRQFHRLEIPVTAYENPGAVFVGIFPLNQPNQRHQHPQRGDHKKVRCCKTEHSAMTAGMAACGACCLSYNQTSALR